MEMFREFHCSNENHSHESMKGKKPVVTIHPPRPAFGDEHTTISDDDRDESQSALDDTVPDDQVSVDSDMEMVEIDEIINTNSTTHMVTKPTDETCDIQAIIDEDYIVQHVVDTLPPVDQNLSQILSSWLCTTPSRETIKDQFQK